MCVRVFTDIAVVVVVVVAVLVVCVYEGGWGGFFLVFLLSRDPRRTGPKDKSGGICFTKIILFVIYIA